MIKYQGSTSSNCVNTATGSLMAKCDYLISHFAISFDARWLSRYFQPYNQFSWNASDVHWTRSKSIINCFPHHFRVHSIFRFIFRQNADFFIQKINKQDSWNEKRKMEWTGHIITYCNMNTLPWMTLSFHLKTETYLLKSTIL